MQPQSKGERAEGDVGRRLLVSAPEQLSHLLRLWGVCVVTGLEGDFDAERGEGVKTEGGAARGFIPKCVAWVREDRMVRAD